MTYPKNLFNQRSMVGINEIVDSYLPVSKRKARKFVSLYLNIKRIGNRIFVDRAQLEALLNDPNREQFPLTFADDHGDL